jgi:hypothetical protein
MMKISQVKRILVQVVLVTAHSNCRGEVKSPATEWRNSSAEHKDVPGQTRVERDKPDQGRHRSSHTKS